MRHDFFGRVFIVANEFSDGRGLVTGGCLIDAQRRLIELTRHINHILFRHAKFFGHKRRRGIRLTFRNQLRARLAQIIEKFASRARGSNAYRLEMIHQIVENHRAYPVLRIRSKLHMAKRIVTLYRFRKPHVAFLNEFKQIGPASFVFPRNLHHKTKVCQHKQLSRFQIVVLLVPHGKFLLAVRIQNRMIANVRKVKRQGIR